MWYGRWVVPWYVGGGGVCMYDSMYGGWLVGKARQQYLVEYVGTWCR